MKQKRQSGDGDILLDIFARYNTNGAAAEFAQRRWIAFEHNPSYLSAFAFRFREANESIIKASKLYENLLTR